MIWDGRILSGKVLGLIETQPPAPDSNTGLALFHSTMQNVATPSAWPQPDLGEPNTPTQNSTWKSSTLLMDDNMPNPIDEVQHAGMASLDGIFTFDMEDLQWLECVQ